MTGPFSGVASLIPIPGPPVLWASPFNQAFPTVPNTVTLGYQNLSGQGIVAPYARCIANGGVGGYQEGDILQPVPWFSQVAGNPGGTLGTRFNQNRIQLTTAQGIYLIRREAANWDDYTGSTIMKLAFRGILSAGPGPYRNNARGVAPAGPIGVGETKEVLWPSGGSVFLPNPAPIEPFMWTIYGRCLVADLGCQPGDIMAFGCAKLSAAVRGWGTTYVSKENRFILSSYAHPIMVGRDGAATTMDQSKWAFFIRFVGTPKGGIFGLASQVPKKQTRVPPRMFMSPPQPLSGLPKALRIAMPDGFTPAVVNSIYICKTAELGFGVGDWMLAQEGDSVTGAASGFSATFNGPRADLVPYNAPVQYLHPVGVSAYSQMTSAYWSWAFVFVG